MNIFETAMSESDLLDYQTIRKNKDFLFKIIQDLENFYHVKIKEKDNQKSVVFTIASDKLKKPPSFYIDKDGVVFNIILSGFKKKNNKNTELGKLYKKYKETSNADYMFLHENIYEGELNLKIPIPVEFELDINWTLVGAKIELPNNKKFLDIIRDISMCLEYVGYCKRY